MSNTEKLIEVINEKREEIQELGEKLYKERYAYGLSGWYVGVEVNTDGDVYELGVMSQNSQTMANFKGEVTVVVKFDCQPFEFDGILEYYDIPDKEEFEKYLQKEYDLDPESEDYEEDLNYRWTMVNYQDFNQEQYEEWKKEDLELEVEEYAAGQVDEQIDLRLQELEGYLSCMREEAE